jgi:hypothetical protein
MGVGMGVGVSTARRVDGGESPVAVPTGVRVGVGMGIGMGVGVAAPAAVLAASVPPVTVPRWSALVASF